MAGSRVAAAARSGVAGAWLPVVLWALLILGLGSDSFSAQQTSRILGPILDWLLPDLDPGTRLRLLGAIRKAAHVGEYGVLAFLSFRALRLATARGALACAGFCLVLVAGLAMADEHRQSGAGARTGSARDVALDATGGALALVGILAFERVRGRPLWGRRRDGDDAPGGDGDPVEAEG